MYKLYSMQRSGNSYKVRLALSLLNAPYRAIEVDILRGESRTPDFLQKNPSGQVPLLEVAEGRYLAESNAILWYVCGGTSLAPERPMLSEPSRPNSTIRCRPSPSRCTRNGRPRRSASRRIASSRGVTLLSAGGSTRTGQP